MTYEDARKLCDKERKVEGWDYYVAYHDLYDEYFVMRSRGREKWIVYFTTGQRSKSADIKSLY